MKRTEIGAGADHEVSAAKLAMTGAGCHDELYEQKNLVQEVEGERNSWRLSLLLCCLRSVFCKTPNDLPIS